ncbi:UNVERIFIED_ORG: hypothetical protein J2W85_007115 [Ensifer adhaerens]|nr:hypothetical protein [Ensifer adhaerens]
MDETPSLTELADNELREVCLVAVFLLAEASYDDGMWRDALEETYRCGWTDKRVTVETIAIN